MAQPQGETRDARALAAYFALACEGIRPGKIGQFILRLRPGEACARQRSGTL